MKLKIIDAQNKLNNFIVDQEHKINEIVNNYE